MILQLNEEYSYNYNVIEKVATIFSLHYERSQICMIKTILLKFILLLVISSSLYAQTKEEEKKPNITGYVDFNGYYDTRDFSVLTYNILANMNRFQYFSLTNYQSDQNSLELADTYAEHNIRWKITESSPLDLTFQYVLRGGSNNDDYRFGLRARLNAIPKIGALFRKLNMSYSFNPMFIQFRRDSRTKYMSIIEHVYRINIAPKRLNDRLYLGGFIDQNFKYLDGGGVKFRYVSEHQMGLRLIDQFYAVLEYRINDFFSDENYGLGYGLEYKIGF